MKKEQTLGAEVVETPVEPFPDYAAIREAKGIELKSLSNSTKIRLSYLEAIEKGNFETLPESIYAETFIKTYARAVGEEADTILAHYRRHLKKNETPSQEATPKQTKLKPEWVKEEGARSKLSFRAVGWIFSGLVLIVFLISFFSTYMTDHSKPEVKPLMQPASTPVAPPADPAAAGQSAAPVVEGQAPATAPLTTGPAAPAAPAPVAAPPVKTPYKLVIEATATSWLNIVEDDNPPFEILLRSGERIEREAKDKFSVDIGNAGGVAVYFQGKSLGPLGKSGQVVHLNLPEGNRNQ